MPQPLLRLQDISLTFGAAPPLAFKHGLHARACAREGPLFVEFRGFRRARSPQGC